MESTESIIVFMFSDLKTPWRELNVKGPLKVFHTFSKQWKNLIFFTYIPKEKSRQNKLVISRLEHWYQSFFCVVCFICFFWYWVGLLFSGCLRPVTNSSRITSFLNKWYYLYQLLSEKLTAPRHIAFLSKNLFNLCHVFLELIKFYVGNKM